MNRAIYLSYLQEAKSASAARSFTGAEWSAAAAVFASRETEDELIKAVSCLLACRECVARIDILVNGNTKLAHALCNGQLATLLAGVGNCDIRVWDIALASKAHVWNLYVHAIAPASQCFLFIDGYVQLPEDALTLMREAWSVNPEALAFSGSPMVGRSSDELHASFLKWGGLHGNCFAFSPTCIEKLRMAKAVLPIGLYGFDTVLGGMLGFGLNPPVHTWDIKRFVHTVPNLRWRVPPKSALSLRDLRTHVKRIRNNALRALVRAATVYQLERLKLPIGDLGVSIDSYLWRWISERPASFCLEVLKSPLSLIEVLQVKRRYSSRLALILPIQVWPSNVDPN